MRAKLFSVVSGLVFILFSAPVGAAPQILGLVATVQPIPLTCVGGICKAEVTTVCLQEHRVAPRPGQAYKVGAGTQITLNILGKSIAARDKVSITTRRHYTSVVISLPKSVVRKYGKGQASISIAALASAVPVPNATDKVPLTAYEIEKYTGPLRQIAENVFERDNINVATTRHLNQVINRLPDDYADDQAQFEKSWAKVANDKSRKMTPEVARATTQIANTCREEFTVGKYIAMRSCLEQHHDVLASDTNNRVWKAMKPGG